MLQLAKGIATFQFESLWFLLLFNLCLVSANYIFLIEEAPYTRLCSRKNILTVNGQYPGPTLEVARGDSIYVVVRNRATENITIHWHGAKMPRYPWTDGPEYITQCPIQPGASFRQRIIFSEEEGTIWWHAHTDWSRATVHGAIFIYPRPGTSYPFPQPDAQVPIILGDWWSENITDVFNALVSNGGSPILSDAFTINGQPGDLYPCSSSETFRLTVDSGKTYLLRMVNAAMSDIFFFSIANHNLTVVGTDGAYTKQLTTNLIVISPGHSLDLLLEANQNPGLYYMAARAYFSPNSSNFDNTTTTAIIQYSGDYNTSSSPLLLPTLPNPNDTASAFQFLTSLQSLADEDHPIDVPLDIDTRIFSTVSLNTLPCENLITNPCLGPNGTRFSASMNNISFIEPSIDILQAYYQQINGVYGENFPDYPPHWFDFTADHLPLYLQTPEVVTEVRVLDYNSTVEVIFQATDLVVPIDHPMHLHGYSFYIVGFGFGNFDEDQDPLNYNLIDPPLRNTVTVPVNGWATIRFRANNPGVWFLHCHLEGHFTWGMKTVFIVRDGQTREERLLPPPLDMPPC